MKIGNTFFISLVIGALWAAIYTIVFSVLSMLITGETLIPDVGTALLSGAAGAACYVVLPVVRRHWSWVVVTAAIALVLQLILSRGWGAFAPASLDTVAISVVIYLVSAFSWHKCLEGMGSEVRPGISWK